MDYIKKERNKSKRKYKSESAIRKYWDGDQRIGNNFWFEKYLTTKNLCFGCGDTSTVNEQAHILARCDGGLDEISNLHMLCNTYHKDSENCNGEKYWLWLEKRTIKDKAFSNYFSLELV